MLMTSEALLYLLSQLSFFSLLPTGTRFPLKNKHWPQFITYRLFCLKCIIVSLTHRRACISSCSGNIGATGARIRWFWTALLIPLEDRKLNKKKQKLHLCAPLKLNEQVNLIYL